MFNLTEKRVSGLFSRGVSLSTMTPLVEGAALYEPDAEGEERDYGFADAIGEPELDESDELSIEELTTDKTTIKNYSWNKGVAVRRLWMERDRINAISRKLTRFGQVFGTLKGRLLIDIVNKGETDAYVGYDGSPLFATDHNHRNSGDQSNLLTTSEIDSLIVSDPDAVSPEQMVEAFCDVAGHMQTFNNGAATSDGETQPMNEDAREFMVLGKPGPHFRSLLTAMNANLLGGGNTSTKDAIENDSMGYRFRPFLSTRFTFADEAFVVLRVDGVDARPFILQEERALDLEILAQGSDEWVKRSRAIVKGSWRGGRGIAESLHAAKATFATS